jgi:hypothetical protein
MGGRYGHHSALSPGFPRTALRDSLARMQKSHGTRIECCVSSQAIALSQTLRALACLPKAAVRDTQRTMPEESTTPDLVELMRKVENLLGLHPELLVSALPVFQESANRRATLKRTHPQRRHVPNSVTGKEPEHRASLDENGIQLTNYTDIAEARSAAERLARERG